MHFILFATINQVCLGSWDSRINLWQTHELGEESDLVTIKRRKMDNKDEESQSEVQ